MGKAKRVPLLPAEQVVLDQLRVVVLTEPDDVKRCDQLIVEHHYLHDATLVGEHLRYAAVFRGQWLAVATWSAAAFHLKDRDQFIGWTHEQCRRRRALLANNSPKQVWVRELERRACVKLRARELPAAWAQVEAALAPKCTYRVEPILSLRELFENRIKEFRRPQSLAYPLPGILSLIVMAVATGVRRGPGDLADYADTLSQGQLRALEFRRDRDTGRYRAPKKTTFGRVLEAVDVSDLESVLLQWQEQLLGPTQDKLVVVDGKKLRHGGAEIVNMVDGNGRFLGSALTPDKTNEIPVARELLRRLDLVDKTVLADALHTNEETARTIHFEKGGDYLLTVKGNQPELQATLQKLFEKQPFSPSTHGGHPGVDARAQLRAHRDPLVGLPGG